MRNVVISFTPGKNVGLRDFRMSAEDWMPSSPFSPISSRWTCKAWEPERGECCPRSQLWAQGQGEHSVLWPALLLFLGHDGGVAAGHCPSLLRPETVKQRPWDGPVNPRPGQGQTQQGSLLITRPRLTACTHKQCWGRWRGSKCSLDFLKENNFLSW